MLVLDLRTVREEHGFSQHELARLSGISRSRIAHYEAATFSVTLDTINSLAGSLNVSPLELLKEVPGCRCGQAPPSPRGRKLKKTLRARGARATASG